MMAFFEWLQRGHEVVSSGNSGCYDALSDTCGNSAFDNGSHGVHRADDLVLELRRNVDFDLLEQVFRSSEASYYQYILIRVSLGNTAVTREPLLTCSSRFCAWIAMIWFLTSSRIRLTTGSKHCKISSFVKVM